MATKKAVQEEPVLLTRDKNELKDKVNEQIELGEVIAFRNVNTKLEYEQLWTDFKDWENFNEELIRQSFNKPVNIYVNEYKYKAPIFIDAIYGERKSFQQEIEDSIESVKYQITKLRRFYNKIDVLKSAEVVVKSDFSKENLYKLLNLLSKFHKVVQALRERYNNQETILIRNEYDVQDLLNGLLRIYFDDVRKEDFSPSNSGGNSRIDFVLKKERIILEVKMTNENLPVKKLGADLLVDIGRYKEYPDCDNLVILIYDKGDFISNKAGLITDLQKQSTNELRVSVVINPE